jgi:transcriptional regulator with PAS, ATPase and Fis domain
MVATGEFRADLYYRLDMATIRTPPLRQRLEDTSALAAHFVAHYNRIFGKQVRWISPGALALLRAYQWPGNVRELAHTIERAILLGENDRIVVDDLPPELVAEAMARIAPFGGKPTGPLVSSDGPEAADDPIAANTALDDALKSAVAQSLDAAHGDCAKAARTLGISRPAIYRKMARYGLRATGGRSHDGQTGASAVRPDTSANDRE